MPCELEISLSGDIVYVQISGCPEMKSLTMMFPKNQASFFGGNTFGISAGEKPYLTIQPNGYAEYISNEVEINFMIPSEVATDFIDYVKQRVDTPVTEKMTFSESENPQEAAGKRRKTRRRRQTKRTRIVY